MLGRMKTSDRVLVILYELQMKGKQSKSIFSTYYIPGTLFSGIPMSIYSCTFVYLPCCVCINVQIYLFNKIFLY